MAQAATNEGITALSPNLPIIKEATLSAAPLIAVNLPKIAPSTKMKKKLPK